METEEKYICTVCVYESTDRDEFMVHEDEFYCDGCYDEKFFNCDHCSEVTEVDNSYEVSNGDHVCQDCLCDHYTTCDECEGRVLNDDTRRTGDDNYICITCYEYHYFTCPDCSEIHHADDLREIYGRDDICRHCAEDQYTCDECGIYVHGDDIIRPRENSDSYCYYCPDCASQHREPSAQLYNYSYKPEWKRHGKTADTFGMEIELQARQNVDNAVNKIHEIFGDFVVCKEDSSTGARGFEIVTHPFDFGYFVRAKVHERLEQLKDICRGFHAKECGIHIHFSRSFLKDNHHLYRLIYFFSQNPKFIELIAQREQTGYWQHERPNRVLEKASRGDTWSNRYDAINIQNAHTIEIRIFASNLKAERILKNLEFVYSIVKYTRDNSSEKLIDFLAWLKVQRRLTTLKTYIEQATKNHPEIVENNL